MLIDKKIRVSKQSIFFLILLIINLLIVVDLNFYAILQPYIAYINLVFLVVTFFIMNMRISKKKFIFLCIMIFTIVSISLLNGSSIGAISAFVCFFLTIYYTKEIIVDILFCKMLCIISTIILLWGIIKSINTYESFIDGVKVVNPNMIGFVIYIAFFINVAFMKNFCDVKKIVYVLVWLVCLMAEGALKDRTGMVVLMLCGIIYLFFPKKVFNNKKLIIFVSFCIMVIGCIFPMIYLFLKNSLGINGLIYTLTGKYLYTGRELIWQRFFEEMKNSKLTFWIGLGSKKEYDIGQGYSMHNLYMQIALNFGIIGDVFFIYFVMLQIKGFFNKKYNETQSILLLAYIGLLLISYSEVVILTPYLLLISNMFLGLAQSDSLYKLHIKETR